MKITPAHLDSHSLYIPVLGILPILVAVTTPAAGIAMGVVFIVACSLATLALLLCRSFFTAGNQWVFLVAVSATAVAITTEILQACNYSLAVGLGIYLPLLAMNALLIGGLQEYVLPQTVRRACLSMLVMVTGVFLVCVITGFVRSLPGLPVLRTSAGLFLFLSLLLAAGKMLVLHMPGSRQA